MRKWVKIRSGRRLKLLLTVEVMNESGTAVRPALARISTGAPLGYRFPGFQLSRWGTGPRVCIRILKIFWNEGLQAGEIARQLQVPCCEHSVPDYRSVPSVRQQHGWRGAYGFCLQLVLQGLQHAGIPVELERHSFQEHETVYGRMVKPIPHFSLVSTVRQASSTFPTTGRLLHGSNRHGHHRAPTTCTQPQAILGRFSQSRSRHQ